MSHGVGGDAVADAAEQRDVEAGLGREGAVAELVVALVVDVPGRVLEHGRPMQDDQVLVAEAAGQLVTQETFEAALVAARAGLVVEQLALVGREQREDEPGELLRVGAQQQRGDDVVLGNEASNAVLRELEPEVALLGLVQLADVVVLGAELLVAVRGRVVVEVQADPVRLRVESHRHLAGEVDREDPGHGRERAARLGTDAVAQHHVAREAGTQEHLEAVAAERVARELGLEPGVRVERGAAALDGVVHPHRVVADEQHVADPAEVDDVRLLARPHAPERLDHLQLLRREADADVVPLLRLDAVAQVRRQLVAHEAALQRGHEPPVERDPRQEDEVVGARPRVVREDGARERPLLGQEVAVEVDLDRVERDLGLLADRLGQLEQPQARVVDPLEPGPAGELVRQLRLQRARPGAPDEEVDLAADELPQVVRAPLERVHAEHGPDHDHHGHRDDGDEDQEPLEELAEDSHGSKQRGYQGSDVSTLPGRSGFPSRQGGEGRASGRTDGDAFRRRRTA